MKLSKQEIQFIDNYLQKHDVVFVDIRAEMIDHIAAAVEDKMDKEAIDFYDAFKSYMIINRKDILKGNKENWGFALSEIKKFAMFLVKPQMLLLLTLLFIVSKAIMPNKNLDFFIDNSPHYFLYSMLFISIIQLVYFYFILKKRFYYIEKNGQLLAILYWLNLLFLQPFDETDTTYFYGILIFWYLFLGYIYFSITQIRNFFKLKLNTL
ncbi:MAG: hypothetical protein ABIQ27_03600 [Flavobacterium sp.]|uniref:hypothetical protein n=1 Tax=Flavobacterium sp. TaxID=239 RepID=UPI003263559C